MWTTFWPDVLVAAIGALFTVGAAAITYYVSLRTKEIRALNVLIRFLHDRRALDTKPGRVPGARLLNDYKWVNLSVLSIKDEIRASRDSSRDFAKVQNTLLQMHSACNEYLEKSEKDPDSYPTLLAELQNELDAAVTTLTTGRLRPTYRTPGRGA